MQHAKRNANSAGTVLNTRAWRQIPSGLRDR